MADDLAKRIADALARAKDRAKGIAPAKEIRFKTGTYTVTFDHLESKLHEAKTKSIGFKVVLKVVGGPCNIGSNLYRDLWLHLEKATQAKQDEALSLMEYWREKLGLEMDDFENPPEIPHRFEVLVETADKGGDYKIPRIDRI